MIAVAAESPGAASVVNAVLLNALLSKVHEATGAEESRAVGLPRSVVRCLFEASVFPAVLAYARDVAVRWRSRTFSSLAGAASAVSLVGVLLGLGVRAIDGLAACDEVAGDKTVIDETFARALCDVGVECEDSICRQLAFEALATTGVFRGDGGEIRRIVLESGRAGMCGGTSEGERDAAAMCAIPFEADADDAGDTPVDEYYWEETLLEEWLLGAASFARRDAAEPTVDSHPIAGRLAFARHVTSRSGRITCRVLRDHEMRGTLVSLALTAAWQSRGADRAPIDLLRTLFVDTGVHTANDEVASARRAVPHDALRGCVDALRKVLAERSSVREDPGGKSGGFVSATARRGSCRRRTFTRSSARGSNRKRRAASDPSRRRTIRRGRSRSCVATWRRRRVGRSFGRGRWFDTSTTARYDETQYSSSSSSSFRSFACFSAMAWASNRSRSNLSYRYPGTRPIST